MALSERKIRGIIADAKADRYGSISALCKKKNITRQTFYTLQKKYNFQYGENTHIIEAGIILEQAKKQSGNLQEIDSINKTIQEKLNTIEIDRELIDKNRQIAQLVQKKIFEKKEDIDISNIKQVTGAIKDIEGIANPKPETINQIETQNQNLIIKYE